METFIQDELASGRFTDASELIDEALQRMRAEDLCLKALSDAILVSEGRPDRELARAPLVRAWADALREGEDALERGDSIAYTPEVRKKLIEAALKAGQGGRPIDPHDLR